MELQGQWNSITDTTFKGIALNTFRPKVDEVLHPRFHFVLKKQLRLFRPLMYTSRTQIFETCDKLIPYKGHLFYFICFKLQSI